MGIENRNTPEPQETSSGIFDAMSDVVAEDTQSLLDRIKAPTQRTIDQLFFSADVSVLGLQAAALKMSSMFVEDPTTKNILLGLSAPYMVEFMRNIALFQKIPVGNHFIVHVGHNHRWEETELRDGTIVKPGETIGILDIQRGMTPLTPDEDVVTYTRNLYKSVREDLTTLANISIQENSPFQNVQAFVGYSRFMGPLAEKLGFDVSRIKNPMERAFHTAASINIESDVSKNNAAHKELIRNKREVKRGYISKKYLIDLFATQTSLNDLNP